MVQLPYEAHAEEMPSWLFMGVAVCFFVASTVWAVRESKVRGNAIPALALGGGFIAALEEPWINTLIQLWYPRDAPLIVFTAMEHAQPLYVLLVYPGFVGLGGYLAYRTLVGHPDGRHLWRMFVGIVLLDLAFELPATTGGVFSYYGDQPFQFIDGAWPAWVAFINAAGPVLGGWLIYQLVPHFTGIRRALVVLVVPPVAYAATYGVAGWPVYTVLKSDVPDVTRWAAALVSIAICLGMVVVIRTVARRLSSDPIRLVSVDPQVMAPTTVEK